jgi:hypothetical protein
MPIVATIFLSSAVFGEDINCQSEYGSVKLKGNVVVAAPCTLNGTEVDGNIRIFAGGSLIAIGAVIDGNIKADTADFIDLQNTEVGGNVELDELVGDVSFIGDSTIDGDIKLDKNRSRLLLLRNYVADNLEVIRNGGGVVISHNVIDGDLLCEKNSPSPEGSNNMVSGKTKNQCRNLQAAPDTVSSGDDSEPSGGSVSDGGSETPPFEIITGTGGGGGGSVGPLLILFLLVVGVVRSRRYGSQYHKYSSTAL